MDEPWALSWGAVEALAAIAAVVIAIATAYWKRRRRLRGLEPTVDLIAQPPPDMPYGRHLPYARIKNNRSSPILVRLQHHEGTEVQFAKDHTIDGVLHLTLTDATGQDAPVFQVPGHGEYDMPLSVPEKCRRRREPNRHYTGLVEWRQADSKGIPFLGPRWRRLKVVVAEQWLADVRKDA